MNHLVNFEDNSLFSLSLNSRESSLKSKQIKVNLPLREGMGGGAQIKYFFPENPGEPGLRLFSDKESLRSDSLENGPLRILETVAQAREPYELVKELLPQLFLPEEVLRSIPQTYAAGVVIKDSYLADSYELTANMSREQKFQLIDQVWKHFSRAGTQKNIFTLVEHIPHLLPTDEWMPDTYGYLQSALEGNIGEYEKGLHAGLDLYSSLLEAGIWNFDLKGREKEPFICKGDKVKILDTGGFAAIKDGPAEDILLQFYADFPEQFIHPLRVEISNLGDDPFNEKRQTLISQKNQLETRASWMQAQMLKTVKEVNYTHIATLLESCYFIQYADSQVQTKALKELRDCYESMTKNQQFWEDMPTPADSLAKFIIMLRRHKNQRINVTQ